MINHDHAAAQRFEGNRGMSDSSVLKKLSHEISALEGPASRETIKNVHDRSRNLATLYRTPAARRSLGTAIDCVFYDKKISKHGVTIRRNQGRPPRFIKKTLHSQFSKTNSPQPPSTNTIRLV